jgi:hypothetical protein
MCDSIGCNFLIGFYDDRVPDEIDKIVKWHQ